uniref:Uncharacterized protein n=1 Tax=Cannabis sativa TaxID=3483 RepID=A0A803QFZ5_CANSA
MLSSGTATEYVVSGLGGRAHELVLRPSPVICDADVVPALALAAGVPQVVVLLSTHVDLVATILLGISSCGSQ